MFWWEGGAFPGSVSEVARQQRPNRRRASAQTRPPEELLGAVVDHAPIVLWAADRDGIFTLSEGSGLERLGLSPGEVVGRSVFEMYAGTPEIEASIRRALTGETVTARVEVGGVVFESWYAPLRGDGREVEGVIGVATDVTERVRAEQALERSEGEYRTLFEDSPIALTAADFSAVKTRIESLRDAGVEDFAAYLDQHPEAVVEWAGLIQVLEVNQAALRLMGARDLAGVAADPTRLFTEQAYQAFAADLLELAEGRTENEWETVTGP